MKKKILSLILAVLTVAAVMPNVAFLASATELPAFSGGSGTQEDPYLISSAQDLFDLREAIYADESGALDAADSCDLGGFHGYYFKQICDIDLAGVAWSPFSFCGVYDGNGYKIINLAATEKRYDSQDPDGSIATDEYSSAFFDQLVHAQIMNLTFENCSSSIRADLAPESGRDIYVGIVAASAIAASFENVKTVGCTVVQNAAVDNISYTGGIVGFSDICNFTNCSVENGTIINGEVAGSMYEVGGITAITSDMYYEYMDYYNMQVGAGKPYGIYNCSVSADISANKAECGGIVAWSDSSYLENNIKNCYFNGSISGGTVSGIISDGYKNDKISNCFAHVTAMTGTKMQAIADLGTNQSVITDCVFYIGGNSDEILGTEGTLLTEEQLTDGTAVAILGEGWTVDENGYPILCVTLTSDIEFVNMTVSADLSYNVYADLTDDDVTAEMRFTVDGKEITVSGEYDESAGLYKYTLAHIPPQGMLVEIKAELVKDGEVLDTHTGTIRDYLDSLIELYPEDAELKVLVADMLNYGAAAQIYTGYDTENLANADTTGGSGFTVLTEDKHVADSVKGTEVEGVKFVGVGVRFDYVNKVYFRFTAPSLEGITVTVNGEEAEIEANGDAYIVYSEAVNATEFASEVVAVLKSGDSTVQTVTYSVESFVYEMQNTEGAAADLARALYSYGLSAIAYDAK